MIPPYAEAIWSWSSPSGKARAERRARFFVEHGSLGPGRRALELGCGTGVFLERVAASGAAIVGLDLGFLFLYRSGYPVSLGALVTQSAAALLLLFVGVAVFRERLSLANAVGLVLCVAGLWLVNRR